MRILNLQQVEILFPIWPLFLKGCWAITNLNPLDGAVFALPRLRHIAEVFAASHRTSAEGAFFNSAVEGFPLTGFDFGGDEISHEEIVLRGE